MCLCVCVLCVVNVVCPEAGEFMDPKMAPPSDEQVCACETVCVWKGGGGVLQYSWQPLKLHVSAFDYRQST